MPVHTWMPISLSHSLYTCESSLGACVCACVCDCTSVCISRGQRRTFGIPLYPSLTYSLLNKTGPVPEPGAKCWLPSLSNPLVSVSHSTGYRHVWGNTWPFTWVPGSELRSSCWHKSTYLLNHLPHTGCLFCNSQIIYNVSENRFSDWVKDGHSL